jgi:hypothetical protein
MAGSITLQRWEAWCSGIRPVYLSVYLKSRRSLQRKFVEIYTGWTLIFTAAEGSCRVSVGTMNNTSRINLDDPEVVTYWREHMGVAQELLREIVAKVGGDPERVGLEVAQKVAAGLSGIVPRSVKP